MLRRCHVAFERRATSVAPFPPPQGSVNALSVHTSGRIALSVARDCTIRMWNLVKGRTSYTSKLDAEAEGVAFFPSGEVRQHTGGGRGLTLCILHVLQSDSCVVYVSTRKQPDAESGGVAVVPSEEVGQCSGLNMCYCTFVLFEVLRCMRGYA